MSAKGLSPTKIHSLTFIPNFFAAYKNGSGLGLVSFVSSPDTRVKSKRDLKG